MKCEKRNKCNLCENYYKLTIDENECFLDITCNNNIYNIDNET